jgi:hypothetical protein
VNDKKWVRDRCTHWKIDFLINKKSKLSGAQSTITMQPLVYILWARRDSNGIPPSLAGPTSSRIRVQVLVVYKLLDFDYRCDYKISMRQIGNMLMNKRFRVLLLKGYIIIGSILIDVNKTT